MKKLLTAMVVLGAVVLSAFRITPSLRPQEQAQCDMRLSLSLGQTLYGETRTGLRAGEALPDPVREIAKGKSVLFVTAGGTIAEMAARTIIESNCNPDDVVEISIDSSQPTRFSRVMDKKLVDALRTVSLPTVYLLAPNGCVKYPMHGFRLDEWSYLVDALAGREVPPAGTPVVGERLQPVQLVGVDGMPVLVGAAQPPSRYALIVVDPNCRVCASVVTWLDSVGERYPNLAIQAVVVDAEQHVSDQLSRLYERFPMLAPPDWHNEKAKVGESEQFIASVAEQVPTALDRTRAVVHAWGLQSSPTLVLIDEQGRVEQVAPIVCGTGPVDGIVHMNMDQALYDFSQRTGGSRK